MNRRWSWIMSIAMVGLAVSCAQPETEEPRMEAAPAEAETAAGPDPTVVDAGHYKTELENDRVRVVRITYGPGDGSVMHYHPDSVAVFLTEHHVEFTSPDGTTEEVHGNAGQHAFTPAEQHLPKNIGEESLEVMLVELKDAVAAAAGEAGPDPVEVDNAHYRTEFENDRVRVVRITYGPGEESVMHYHPDSVAVFLTEHHAEFTSPDGTTEEVHSDVGEYAFTPAGQHLPKNIGEDLFELVLVELK